MKKQVVKRVPNGGKVTKEKITQAKKTGGKTGND